jgi:hypothetical protein
MGVYRGRSRSAAVGSAPVGRLWDMIKRKEKKREEIARNVKDFYFSESQT